MRGISANRFSSVAFIDCQYRFIFCLAIFSLFLVPFAFANEPPRPGELEYLQQTGQFEERLNAAKVLGNHLIDSARLDQAIYRSKRDMLQQRGINAAEVLPAPPSALGLLPTKGNVKAFALLIDFLDYPGYSTLDQINSALFGDGSLLPNNVAPTESLTNYYRRSSYGQLDFSSGTTLGWYHAPYSRSNVLMTTAGRENLIKEAITALGATTDFSQFDNDGNGQIEYFLVIWTGPNNGWSGFWWGYQTSFSDTSYTINGKRLGKYSWQWEGSYGATGPFSASTVIHETGHALGLPDYYDYDTTKGPNGGLGRLDMMDGNWGDHNCFSKWVLDWLSPTVVGSGTQSLTLNPSGISKDAVLIAAGASGNTFDEFFMVQNRYRTGNDEGVGYPTDGMLIWHVDATLNAAGTSYQYNNSTAAHKLLKLMQADGLDRIESESARADAAMYYQTGKILGSTTTPSSKNYRGIFTRAHVENIVPAWPQMYASFSIEDAGIGSILTLMKGGVGSGISTSNKPGIACGLDCVESYLKGETVTLTAEPAAGSVFSGWSGGGCSGVGTCVVTLSADTTVTASFGSTLLISEDFDPESSTGPSEWNWTNVGGARWWFTYDKYNTSGGAGESALGAVAVGNSGPPFDTELRTPVVNLSSYRSIGLEFKTSMESSGETADVDISLSGAAGPWTNVWRVTGTSPGPQTINIDLSTIAAGNANVMLRFHLYGSSIWWVIDDVKLMAVSSTDNSTVTLSSEGLNFGSVTLGKSSSSQSVTLTNRGTSVLNIGSITLGGTNPSDFAQTNDCSGSLAAGSACTLRIIFTPMAAGVRAASLSIADNAVGSPRTVALVGNGSNVTTASTRHIFPQIADGYLTDGSYYQSTLMVTNSSPGAATPSCTFQLHGLTIGGQSSMSFAVPDVYLYGGAGNTQALQTGYASLQCSSNVEAQLLYSEYAPTGDKISEATVFSSPATTALSLIADERNGTQLALAIANDSASTGRYTINIYNASGTLISSPQLTINPGANRALYLNQLATIPSDYLGLVDIIATSGTASVIGLRFTGNLFTTVPATMMGIQSATVSTRHVFPQIADGHYTDGSYYQSTLLVTNANPTTTSPSCTLQLNGLSIGGQSTMTFTVSGAYLYTSPGNTQALQTGYASLSCSSNVEAQLLYAEYSSTGAKISEATVFSSIPANSLRIIADERDGTQLALAVANDSPDTGRYTVNIYNAGGVLIASPQLSVNSGKNRALFLDELAPLSDGYVGTVDIVSTSGTASVIGVRYTGNLFTTIPATVMR
jgi:M6 family metalloprotease-like protein